MKQRNSLMTIVLTVLVIIIGGVTVINQHWNESWKLFWYDLKNGFSGFGWIYPAVFVAVFALSAASALVLYWIFFWRKMHKNVHNAPNMHKYARLYIYIYIYACIVLLAVCVVINIKSSVKSEAKCCWQPTKTIGHSFGAVNGDTYTGSWEAFEENYAQGRRVMEVDIILTSDNKCVLKHDWNSPVQEGISEENIPNEEIFLSTGLDGKYTPMSFEQLCEIMIEYPDLWIVTDTKYTEEDDIRRQFEVIVDTINGTGHPEILDRFIVQVYNEQMYEYLSDRYNFKTYIFTMYKRFYTDDTVGIFRDVCRYCVNNGIEVVTIKYRRYHSHSEELQQIADTYGIKLYVHTVNDLDVAEELMNAGVVGICTDEIYDDDL